MLLSRRLVQFVEEVAMIATTAPDRNENLTLRECIIEYTDQILVDDYYCVVNYANSKGVKIPKVLRNAIDLEF